MEDGEMVVGREESQQISASFDEIPKGQMDYMIKELQRGKKEEERERDSGVVQKILTFTMYVRKQYRGFMVSSQCLFQGIF